MTPRDEDKEDKDGVVEDADEDSGEDGEVEEDGHGDEGEVEEDGDCNKGDEEDGDEILEDWDANVPQVQLPSSFVTFQSSCWNLQFLPDVVVRYVMMHNIKLVVNLHLLYGKTQVFGTIEG